MEIRQYLNTTSEAVQLKKFNIWIGISLGNKYFSRENIEKYLKWSLENTKEKVAILIPDKIHAINYEIKSKYSKDRALRVALRKGENVKILVNEIISKLNTKASVEILKWADIEDKLYLKRKDILYSEFENNPKFHNKIMEIIKESVGPEIIKLQESDYEKLASYPLDELPVLICGFKVNSTLFNLLPYPNVSLIDNLIIDLLESRNFPKLSEKLKITDKNYLIEAYA